MSSSHEPVDTVSASSESVLSAPRPRAISQSTDRAKSRPARNLAIFGAVAGLVASVALPAYAAFQPQEDSALTIQQVAEDGAQSLTVASDAKTRELDRTTYEATTAAEIDQKKAEEAAAQRATELAAQAQASQNAQTSAADPVTSAPAPAAAAPVATGSIVWPLPYYDYIGDGFGARGGTHDGVDMLAPAMTPILAAADGVVVVSSENYFGFGVAVGIDSQINGQRVTTWYAHMTYGTRLVGVGETVVAGQQIGSVGSTGNSSANHLHFEVELDGALTDPLGWLP